MPALIRVTASVAGVPAIVLLCLVAAGALAPAPAALGLAVIAAAAILLALHWTSDLRRLADILHAIGTSAPDRPMPPRQGPLTLLPALLSEIAQLSTPLDQRAGMVERLRHAEESIVERLPDPLIVLGPDRTVRRTNAAARLAFGAELAAVLRHPELRAATDRALAASAPEVHIAELRIPVPVAREVHATVAALDSPLSGGAGVLVVLSDRTRERAIERTRADFVANASHELRTPLASLMGFIDTLRGPAADDPPAQKRFLDIMADQAARMNRLIDDLLSLSRIELVEHQPPDAPVDLVDLTRRMIDQFEIRIAQRHATLDWRPPEDTPLVAGDEDQLEQVFQNLLDNALKYGRESGVVRVALATASGGAWPARPGVVLSVADDGPGIPKRHLPRLTERFYRVDTGRSRAIGGTGLGLAIVKHVVNRHRGQMLIESEEGQGAIFSVWLPTIAKTPAPTP
jgi:two-component system phosphate regulon sensor histidine kinase PhoR